MFQAPAVADDRLDIVIRGARVVDGSGAPWYVADIGIDQGRIVRIGALPPESAETVIEAEGLIVAPGFIDMMGQTASPMLDDPASALNLLTQGVTTINAGEGESAAPLSAELGLREGYTTMAEYFALIDSQGLPINVVQTVGHTQVRQMVIGDVDRRPSNEELARMQDLVREGMEAGAIGLSTALIYPPAVYATTQELAALASVAGEYGGHYYTHMRNEGDRLLEAVDEALDIGRTGNTPVHIFHLKAAGQQNWGKMQLAISTLRAARSDGQQVTADIYPYINNGLGIAALIHPRHFEQGEQVLRGQLDNAELRAEIRQEMETTVGWENWYRHAGQNWNRIIVGRSSDPRYRPHHGKSVAAIAQALEEDPWETFFQLVKTNAFVLPETMLEANLILAMQQDFISFCTDVGPAGGSGIASHPRAFGAFPRLLSRYVRDLGAISLERAVAQACAVAANEVLAFDRGRIAIGLAADLIVFDYKQLTDRADFAHPDALAEGMRHVIVNGQLVLKEGQYTGARPGRVLRGPGYRDEIAPCNVASGKEDERFACYDRMMHDFLQEHRVPGAAIAVTDRGQLVFSRGYGYGDLADKQPVTPESLFRIASVSKPITAVATLQLIERNQLNLKDKVLDVLDLENEIAAVEPFDARWRSITIRHLLEHRGGWDRDKSFDAMFESVRFANLLNVEPPAGPTTVVRAMLREKLDFEPGERFAYSNFGYCLLGRVIEQISGLDYESYVQQEVLAPLGITTMRLGATRLEGRAPQEVRYYQPGRSRSVFASDLGQTVAGPYGGWNIEAMDAHGGWLATATDLAKFAAAFDDPDHCPILSRESIRLMHDRPPGLAGYSAEGEPTEAYYSLGWNNRIVKDNEYNCWHGGSLPGTTAVMIRRHDGKNFIALLNTRATPTNKSLGQVIDRLMHEMANAVPEWP